MITNSAVGTSGSNTQMFQPQFELDKVQYIGRKFTPCPNINRDIIKLSGNALRIDASLVSTVTNTIIPMAIDQTRDPMMVTPTSLIFNNLQLNPNFQKRDGEFKLRLLLGSTVVESTPFRIDNDDHSLQG